MFTSSRNTRSSTRHRLLAAERRARRAQILRENRAARRHSNNDLSEDDSSDSDELSLVEQHFNRMRNRPQRLPSHDAMSDEEDNSENILYGIQEFDSPTVSFPSTPYTFKYPDLINENNYVCPHCKSALWKEERRHRLNCCNNGKYTIPSLQPVPQHLMSVFRSSQFQRAQRAYNGLFSFTALGAGGVDKRSWTQPRKVQTMLTLHGKAYHRIFDLQQQYRDMNVSNSSRFYIFDNEFAQNCASRTLNADVANILRTHIRTNVRWAREYRSAVDSVLNSPNTYDPNIPTPYIEFADVSRVSDGAVLGEQVSAPEIAALVYTSGQHDSGKRASGYLPR